jgi:diaminopimelate epimerase
LTAMEFSKYEAAANDFIMLDRTGGGPLPSGEAVRALCDRHTGVGADGVIVMLPSQGADLAMRIFNADGTEAQMCGNGARALFRFALDSGAASGESLLLETAAGLKEVRKSGGRGRRGLYTVDMGEPSLKREDIPVAGTGEAVGIALELADRSLTVTCVGMGNPHCVLFVDDIEAYPVREAGPLVETHAMFPERTNVEFVQVVDSVHLRARVWERGVGETMACGTGACASLVAAGLNGLTGKRASVALPGGDLEVEWTDSGVLLTGPARRVFTGETVE